MSVPERHRAAAAPAESAPRTVKLLLLSKYSYKGASSRYRLLQYLPQLESAGIHCTVSPLFGDDYLEFLYRAGRPRKRTVVMAYLKRARALLKVREYDAVLVEKELFPYFPPWVERALAGMDFRLVSSYDDALFHQYDRHSSGLIRRLLGGKIDAVMRHSRLVIAGNSYLGDHASRA